MRQMRTLTRETYQMIKLNLKNLLIFEIVYRLITGPVFLQAMNYGLRFSLKMAGYSYLTLENLGRFLIRPWTVLVILVVSALGIVLLMIEVGGLVTAYTSAAYSVRLKPMDIFLGGIEKLADEVKRKNIRLVFVTVVDMVLINSYYLYRILTRVKPLDFMMKAMMEEAWMRGILAAAVILAVMIAVPAVFVLHGCMVEQKTFRDSFAKSRDLLRKRRVNTIFQLVCYQVLLAVAAVVCYVICVVFAGIFVIVFVDKKLEFAFLMETCRRIEWVLLFFAGIASSILYFGAVTVRYFRYNHQTSQEPGWDFGYSQGRRLGKKNGFVVLGLIGIASAMCLFDTAYNGNALTRALAVETEITAHRGSSKTAPENTMEALKAAVEELADRVEIDVQETSDGEVVLSHDTSLKRTTGVNKKVGDLTYEELKKLDAGSWFSEEYKDARIPSLREVMDFAKGRIDLNIEIKNLGGGSRLPEKVLALVEEYGMEEQCVITSTNLSYLRRIKELKPEIKTGYILSAAYGDYFADEAVDFISIRSNFVTDHVVEKSHEAGKAVHAWTVNSKNELERLRVLGVDNIITDYPVLAREVLYREEVTENLLEYLRVLLR